MDRVKFGRVNSKLHKTVFKFGKTIRAQNFFAKVLCSDDETARFAVVVSKKTAKRSVDRNLIKRRAREILRASLPVRSYALVLSVNNSELGFARMKKEILEVVEKVVKMVE